MYLPFSLSIQVFAFIITFILALAAGIAFVPVLKRLKVKQTIRDDGPATHLKKIGTPTMGGIIFLLPIMLSTVFFADGFKEVIPMMLVTIAFGLIGFLDDYLKVVKRHKDGLTARQKMLGLIVIGALFSIYLVYISNNGSEMIIPFKDVYSTVNLPVWIYIPLVILVFAASTNSVNLTDGVDGLAASVTLTILVFFTIVAMTDGRWDHVKLFSAVSAGGCLGFLAFNAHPARIMMGDTGSLALGGGIAAISLMLKMPWILLLVGIIYVIESVSVIMQVFYFKSTGKRIFKMAPIHHHFELSGWRERKIVWVFTAITAICCLAGIFVLRLKIL